MSYLFSFSLLLIYFHLVESNRHLLFTNENVSTDNELVQHEDDVVVETERKLYASKVHVTPAASLTVKTFVASSANVSNEERNLSNEKLPNEHDVEFERNFLRAVDRALGVVNANENDSLQPVYDWPINTDETNMNLVEMTEHALSSLNNTEFLMVRTFILHLIYLFFIIILFVG